MANISLSGLSAQFDQFYDKSAQHADGVQVREAQTELKKNIAEMDRGVQLMQEQYTKTNIDLKDKINMRKLANEEMIAETQIEHQEKQRLQQLKDTETSRQEQEHWQFDQRVRGLQESQANALDKLNNSSSMQRLFRDANFDAREKQNDISFAAREERADIQDKGRKSLHEQQAAEADARHKVNQLTSAALHAANEAASDATFGARQATNDAVKNLQIKLKELRSGGTSGIGGSGGSSGGWTPGDRNDPRFDRSGERKRKQDHLGALTDYAFGGGLERRMRRGRRLTGGALRQWNNTPKTSVGPNKWRLPDGKVYSFVGGVLKLES